MRRGQEGERKAGCVMRMRCTQKGVVSSHKYIALVRGRRFVIISELIAYI